MGKETVKEPVPSAAAPVYWAGLGGMRVDELKGGPVSGQGREASAFLLSPLSST